MIIPTILGNRSQLVNWNFKIFFLAIMSFFVLYISARVQTALLSTYVRCACPVKLLIMDRPSLLPSLPLDMVAMTMRISLFNYRHVANVFQNRIYS